MRLVRYDRYNGLEEISRRLNRLMEILEDDIRLAAWMQAPVLVTSANPDQRSLCARLIHATGDCWRGPFVIFSVNGDDDVLRRLFDHARGGTFFVEDVATLSPNVQAQLLSILDERVRPHHSTGPPARAGVRIIAGASRHLDSERATGAFCETLFYRLNVFHVDLMN